LVNTNNSVTLNSVTRVRSRIAVRGGDVLATVMPAVRCRGTLRGGGGVALPIDDIESDEFDAHSIGVCVIGGDKLGSEMGL
jgi:hypothetical protein